MTWTSTVFFIIGVVVCAFGLLVLRGFRINAQLNELIEERKAAREEARRVAREHEELRDAAE